MHKDEHFLKKVVFFGKKSRETNIHYIMNCTLNIIGTMYINFVGNLHVNNIFLVKG